MKKSLRNLAKVAAGLGAAYAISKMGKADVSAADTGDLGTREANVAATKSAKRFKGVAEKVKGVDLAKFPGADDKFYDAPVKSRRGIYGEPGSIEGFREANRQAALRRGRQFTESEGSPIALRRKRLGYKKGGSVVARGNKLARSKPTKLF